MEQQIKDYKLSEEIAQGGFDKVYRAFQSAINREVAVKVIHPHLANQPEFIRRFEAEAQIIARLEHPFIIWHASQDVLAVFRVESRLYDKRLSSLSTLDTLDNSIANAFLIILLTSWLSYDRLFPPLPEFACFSYLTHVRKC